MMTARIAAVITTTAHSAGFDRPKAAKTEAPWVRFTRTRPRFAATRVAKARARASGSGSSWRNAITNSPATSPNTSAPCRRLQTAKAGGEERCGRIARRPAHCIPLLALGLEHDRAHRIDDHFEKRDVKRP